MEKLKIQNINNRQYYIYPIEKTAFNLFRIKFLLQNKF